MNDFLAGLGVIFLIYLSISIITFIYKGLHRLYYMHCQLNSINFDHFAKIWQIDTLDMAVTNLKAEVYSLKEIVIKKKGNKNVK